MYDRAFPDGSLDDYLSLLYPSEMEEDEELPWPDDEELTNIVNHIAEQLPAAIRKKGFDPP